MANIKTPQGVSSDSELMKQEWLESLSALVGSIESWAKEFGWATRRIEKTIRDQDLGPYQAPALVFQDEFTRGMLEPLYHPVAGSEGVVDLYLMPAYDDIAKFFYSDGKWSLYRMPPRVPAVGRFEDAGPGTLTKETFREVLEGMKADDVR